MSFSETRTEDPDVRSLVTRLARAHPSGGNVIERAAILASGADLAAVIDWITAHDGQAEATASAKPARGLHSARNEAVRVPLRYVLPPGALD